MTFSERLHERMVKHNTRVCLGIDPRPNCTPAPTPMYLKVTLPKSRSA